MRSAAELGRVRASFALGVGALTLASAEVLRLFPRPTGEGPRLGTAWIASALGLVVAALLASWLARPRRTLALGLVPIAAAITLALPLLALMEPAVREALGPASLELAAAISFVVAALRVLEVRVDVSLPKPPPEDSAASHDEARFAVARDVLERLVEPSRVAKLLAASSMITALALVAAILFTKVGTLDRLELWLPLVAAMMLGAGAVPMLAVRAAAHARLLHRALDAGLFVSRARDLEALASIRRWQVDPELLAAPGPVQVLELADVSQGELLRVAEALASAERGPEHASLRNARIARKVEAAGAAALRRDDGLFRGTVSGKRWYMGPERVVSELDPKAIEPSFATSIEFLRERCPITWILGSPEHGAVGAVGLSFTCEPAATELARAVGATLLPGLADTTRQAIARTAGLTCDGRPLSARDASLLPERAPRPSAGLRVRVLAEGALPSLDEDACPRIRVTALDALARGLPRIRAAGKRRGRMIAALVVPPLASAALALLGVAIAPVYALVPILTAAALARAPRDRAYAAPEPLQPSAPSGGAIEAAAAP